MSGDYLDTKGAWGRQGEERPSVKSVLPSEPAPAASGAQCHQGTWEPEQNLLSEQLHPRDKGAGVFIPQRRLRAAPGGSIPHQFGPAAWEAKWAREARKTILHQRNISAGSGKYGQRTQTWEGPGAGVGALCHHLLPTCSIQTPSRGAGAELHTGVGGGAWPTRSQLCTGRGSKQVKLPRKKPNQAGINSTKKIRANY